MVYTAGSLSLAAVEMLVNLDSEQVLMRYMAIPVAFDDHHCKRIAAHQLPTGWAGHPILSSTRDLGSAWVQSKASAILAVPSALVPIETNFLINPLHPEFPKIRIGRAAAFAYDSRLIKK
jgi:RES domain-containing protein